MCMTNNTAQFPHALRIVSRTIIEQQRQQMKSSHDINDHARKINQSKPV